MLLLEVLVFLLATFYDANLLQLCIFYSREVHIAPSWACHQYPQPPLMWPLGGPERCKQSLVLLLQHQQSLLNQQEWHGLVMPLPMLSTLLFDSYFHSVLFVNVKTFRKLSKYLVWLGEQLNRNCLSSSTQECLFTAKVKLNDSNYYKKNMLQEKRNTWILSLT